MNKKSQSLIGLAIDKLETLSSTANYAAAKGSLGLQSKRANRNNADNESMSLSLPNLFFFNSP